MGTLLLCNGILMSHPPVYSQFPPKQGQSGYQGSGSPSPNSRGTAGTPGPIDKGLRGWRGKGADKVEITLQMMGEKGIEGQVERLIGKNPFVLSSVAGIMDCTRGMDPNLESRMNQVLKEGGKDDFICIVVPSLPAQRGVEQWIEENGVRVIRVLTPNGYVVRGSSANLKTIAKDPMVYWIGEKPWNLKIDPLVARDFNIPGVKRSELRGETHANKCIVVLYDSIDRAELEATIASSGGTVERFVENLPALYCEGLDAAAVISLSKLPIVTFIDARRAFKCSLETSVGLVNHESVRDNNVWGLNVPVALIDSGFQLNHNAFSGNGTYPQLFINEWNVSGQGNQFEDNPSGHGTHVGGILLSRWNSQSLDGMAPHAGGTESNRFRVVRAGRDDGENPLSLFNLDQAFDIIRGESAVRLVNNSWGVGDSGNTGTSALSVLTDDLIWDTGQTWVFAAGNSGMPEGHPGPFPVDGSIEEPAAAKNSFAVGNVTNAPGLQLWSTSSEGPTGDGRAKPDIYAPGASVTSADAGNLTGSTNFTGTSMASPHITGFIATLMGHYPEFQGRPALAKAYTIATAARKPTLANRTGVLDSGAAHAASKSAGHWGWFDDDPRDSGWIEWDVDGVPANVIEMYVVLTWIEQAPQVGASSAVFNDVDLWVDHNKNEVTGQAGEYMSDSVNDNVEWVHIPNPPAGDYRIKAVRFEPSTEYRPAYGLFYRTSDPPATATRTRTRTQTSMPTPTNTQSQGGSGPTAVYPQLDIDLNNIIDSRDLLGLLEDWHRPVTP